MGLVLLSWEEVVRPRGDPSMGFRQCKGPTSWRKNTGISRVRSSKEGRTLMGVAVVGGAAGRRTQELERVLGSLNQGTAWRFLRDRNRLG